MPDAGWMFLDDRDITSERPQTRGIGIVYQDQALFPHLSVYQNIAYGLHCLRLKRSHVRERTRAMAERVGAQELLNRRPATLSGGEAQRVALARTLATGPKCLLLDEPISALDIQSKESLRSLLREINRQGQTILHVTHDYEEALSLASRIAIMEDGRIAQVGTPEQIFHAPKSQFVARFVGIKNFFAGTLEKSDENGQLCVFAAERGMRFHVLTDAKPGPGFLVFGSEDVAIGNSRPETSAKNVFPGTVLDIAPAKLGVEVSFDIGVRVSALLTQSSVSSLELTIGKSVFAQFKASAARFFPE